MVVLFSNLHCYNQVNPFILIALLLGSLCLFRCSDLTFRSVAWLSIVKLFNLGSCEQFGTFVPAVTFTIEFCSLFSAYLTRYKIAMQSYISGWLVC